MYQIFSTRNITKLRYMHCKHIHWAHHLWRGSVRSKASAAKGHILYYNTCRSIRIIVTDPTRGECSISSLLLSWIYCSKRGFGRIAYFKNCPANQPNGNFRLSFRWSSKSRGTARVVGGNWGKGFSARLGATSASLICTLLSLSCINPVTTNWWWAWMHTLN